jgi:hypothetical protein
MVETHGRKCNKEKNEIQKESNPAKEDIICVAS